jgi:hypothetical protein
MSINPLNDISRVYLEQVALSEAKVDKKLPEHERSGARLKRYDNPSGALELGGGKQRARRAEHEARRGKPKRWWDDDGDGVGYEKGEVSGKFKRKKKLKESFSNWREDLFEIVDEIDNQKEQPHIQEKKVKNKITINPTIGEAVEELGGTLLEMIEIDELDFIVESVYDELVDEGYYESDIEEALEYALVEARVTYGHDTPSMEKKREGLLSVVRKRLSAIKKSMKKNIKKGAEYVARKMSDEDETKPSAAHSKPGVKAAQPYRGAGVGRVEKAGSPKPKRMERPSDPWEGSETTPSKEKEKRPAAKPKTTKVSGGSTKSPTKPKTTKVSGGSTKSPTKRKRTSKLDDLLADIRSESISIGEQSFDINTTGHRQQQRIEKASKLQQATKGAESSAAGSAVRRLGGSGISLPLANSYEPKGNMIDEKILTASETKKKEKIVKSMKGKLADFEKRYPGRGKEVMYATATKIAKKITEQQLDELAPLAIGAGLAGAAALGYGLHKMGQGMKKDRKDVTNGAGTAKPGTIKGNIMQRNQQLKQLMQSYEPEGEILDERRREDKGKPRPDTTSLSHRVWMDIRSRNEDGFMTKRGKKTVAQHKSERGVPERERSKPKPSTPAQRLARKKAKTNRREQEAVDMYKPRAGESD